MTDIPDPNVISIQVLRLGSRNLISSLLNPPKIIPNENGIPRDWRGLAHLVGLKSEKIPVIACDSDPTSRVLNLWARDSNGIPCTVEKLREFLAELDRFDIIDDTQQIIDNDMLLYINEPQNSITTVSPMDDDIESKILTVDDVNGISQGLGTQFYDAFVVFADEDIDFATELIENMEKQYGLKLCVKERDLVAGLPFEHKAIIQLISERCNRLIVIISPAYLRSSANSFVVNYAQALGIEQGKRKIIPCLYEPCELPLELKHIFFLKYQRSAKLYNFWERLKNSIQSPTENTSSIRINTPSPRPVSISEEIHSNFSERLPDLKPALTNKNSLKPKKDGVKFGSLSNLTVIESTETKRSISENALHCESTSSSPSPVQSPVQKDVKPKNKYKFLKKLLPYVNKEKTASDAGEKQKKTRFFSMKTKIKVPVVS